MNSEQKKSIVSESYSNSNQISIQIASSMKKLGVALSAIRSFLEMHSLDEAVIAKSNAVLREMLTNAICHGNQMDENRVVQVIATFLDQHRLCISVIDEGPGFDYRSFDEEILTGERIKKRRGYYLIKSLSDLVEFNSEGNTITAWLSVQE